MSTSVFSTGSDLASTGSVTNYTHKIMSSSYNYQNRRRRPSRSSPYYTGSRGEEGLDASVEDTNTISSHQPSRTSYKPRSPLRPSHVFTQDNPSREEYRKDRWQQEDSYNVENHRLRKPNAHSYDYRREDYYEHTKGERFEEVSSKDWKERKFNPSSRSGREWGRNNSNLKGNTQWREKSRREEKVSSRHIEKDSEYEGHSATPRKNKLDNGGNSRHRDSWKLKDKDRDEESRVEISAEASSSAQERLWTPGASWQAAEQERLAQQTKFDHPWQYRRNNAQFSDRFSKSHNQWSHNRHRSARMEGDPNNWNASNRGRYGCSRHKNLSDIHQYTGDLKTKLNPFSGLEIVV